MNPRCEICNAPISTNQLCCAKCFRLAPWELKHAWESARHFGQEAMDVAGRKILDHLHGKEVATSAADEATTDNPQLALL